MSIRQYLHRRYKKMEAAEHSLLYLFCEVTRRCNLVCLHCGSDCKSQPQAAQLTTDSWLAIIDYMAEVFGNPLSFIFTGGEPLLYPDLETLGRAIAQRKMTWGMVTNGLLLTEERLCALTQAGLSSVTISLDGLEESHNWLRNSPTAFGKAVNAIEGLCRAPLKYADVVTCVNPRNLNELDGVAELLVKKGLHHWRLFRIFPSGRARGNGELLLDFEQTQNMLQWIAAHRKRYKKEGLTVQYSCEGYLPSDFDGKVRSSPFFCRAGINIASILCDGTITGCNNNHSSFFEGNILDDDFLNVWNNRFEKFRQRDWLRNTTCNDCSHRADCQGSSIHLWQLPDDKPAFCYLKDFDTRPK